jgi:YD repeat-containing protein
LEAVQDALSNSTSYSYDNAGRLTNTVYADGSFLAQAYDFLNRVISTTDGAGVSVTKYYDDFGRMYTASNGMGQLFYNLGCAYIYTSSNGVNQLFYNQFDNEDHVTNSMDANGVVIANAYDPLGRILTRSYPDGGVELFGYTAAGLTAYTNQITNMTYYGYDAASRKIAETNSLAKFTLYAYDSAGDMTNLTDAKGSVTQWGYDMYGRVTNKVDATGTNILKYQYDANGRLTNRWSLAKSNTVYA